MDQLAGGDALPVSEVREVASEGGDALPELGAGVLPVEGESFAQAVWEEETTVRACRGAVHAVVSVRTIRDFFPAD